MVFHIVCLFERLVLFFAPSGAVLSFIYQWAGEYTGNGI